MSNKSTLAVVIVFIMSLAILASVSVDAYYSYRATLLLEQRAPTLDANHRMLSGLWYAAGTPPVPEHPTTQP